MKNIRHTGVYVNDMERMRSFYRDILGMQELSYGEEKGPYIEQILGLKSGKVLVCKLSFPGGGMLELVQTDEEEKRPEEEPVWRQGKHHIAVTVENLEQEYQRLKDMGLQFISEPCTSPDAYAKVCFCRDEEGNYLELVEELNN